MKKNVVFVLQRLVNRPPNDHQPLGHRFPALHLPASLYKYVTEGLRKPILYILNKVPLAGFGCP